MPKGRAALDEGLDAVDIDGAAVEDEMEEDQTNGTALELGTPGAQEQETTAPWEQGTKQGKDT